MLNLLTEAIEKKGNAVGTFLGVSTPAILEALKGTGLDFVIIDTEHGPYGTESVSDLISAAASSGISPLVRIADLTHGEMQHALDNGADGVIIPCLRSFEDFKLAVDLGKFRPLGKRGFIKGRGAGFGNAEWSKGPLENYLRNSDKKALILPQCETLEALDNIEKICAIEGIDGIFIGPFDLSISMGIPGHFDDPSFKAAVQRVFKACKDSGKLCLIYTGSTADAAEYLGMGFDAVANNNDFAVLADAYAEMVEEMRR